MKMISDTAMAQTWKTAAECIDNAEKHPELHFDTAIKGGYVLC